jgi:hypothetical protein
MASTVISERGSVPIFPTFQQSETMTAGGIVKLPWRPNTDAPRAKCDSPLINFHTLASNQPGCLFSNSYVHHGCIGGVAALDSSRWKIRRDRWRESFKYESSVGLESLFYEFEATFLGIRPNQIKKRVVRTENHLEPTLWKPVGHIRKVSFDQTGAVSFG